MKRYENGTEAPYGLYLSMRPLDVRFVGSDGEALEGRPGARYRHLPTWMVVVLGPALGGAFVIAFPLLVIVALIGTLANAAIKSVTKDHAYVARSNWQPSAAYFNKDGETKKSEDGVAEPELEALADEANARADEEKKQS